ncbi:MAG: hypothetical protein ACLQQ4_02510 [Bacteroidia bacterium]
MTKPLYIPVSSRRQGVKTWCSVCRQEVSDICIHTGKKLQSCKNGDKHKFKLIARIPGTEDGRKTKLIETRDLGEAIIEAIQYKKEVKEATIQSPLIPNNSGILQPEPTKINENNIPTLLVEALAKYSALFQGEGVYDFKQRHRCKRYRKDTIRSYVHLLECLAMKGYDLDKLTISEFLTEETLNEIFLELEDAFNTGEFGGTTYNKRLDCFHRFEVWLSESLKYPFYNLFRKLERKIVTHTPTAISEEDFQRLIKQITPENGVKLVNYKSRKYEYYYQPWLANGFKLALFTGARREELVMLKYSSIKYDNNDRAYIAIENFKVNRYEKLTGNNKKYIPVAVSDDLLKLLIELGYDKYKGTDTYILAPEITENRERMCDKLTKGFHHYYQQLNTGLNLTFYSLKRTNITAQHLHSGKDFKPTHHSGIKVEIDRYVDQKVIKKGKHGYKVFPRENNKKKSSK